MRHTWDYPSGCDLVLAKVNARVRCGAAYARSVRKFRVTSIVEKLIGRYRTTGWACGVAPNVCGTRQVMRSSVGHQ